MSAKTGIEWTDATWTPFAAFDRETGKRGWMCTKVSEGCKFCYAETINKRLGNGLPYAVKSLDRVEFRVVNLDQPLRWRTPKRIFVNSMTDTFHESVTDAMLDDLFAVMALADKHQFQVLTKRADRMREYFADQWRWAMIEGSAQRIYHERTGDDDVDQWLAVHGLPNVWLGVSVENQDAANERIPHLLQTPAAIRFLSCEPLLGPVDLGKVGGGPWYDSLNGWRLDPGGVAAMSPVSMIGWVIVGGESGPGARPMDTAWVWSLIDQCSDAEVAVFVKQLGAVPMMREDDWRSQSPTPLLEARNRHRVPAGFVPLAQSDKKGGDVNEWPSSLRVREFPEPRVTA